MGVERLAEAAAALRGGLREGQRASEQMAQILGSFDDRLSTLEAAMRPTQIRTHAFRKAHENIDRTLKQAEEVLSQFDVPRQESNRISEGPKRDLESYLRAVDKLQKAVEFFLKNRQFRASEAALQSARDLLKEATSRLEDDFRSLLTTHSKSISPEELTLCLPETPKPPPPPSTPTSSTSLPSSALPSPSPSDSSSSALDPSTDKRQLAPASEFAPVQNTPAVNLPQLLPPAVVQKLHIIGERLCTGGGNTQCTATYREIRDKTLEQSLRRLGVERLRAEDIYKMQWEELEGRISAWIRHLRIALLVLFAGEKKLCDEILDGLDPHRERTFADLADNGASMLFSFGQAIARSKKSPEKLFVLLDMYETLRDLMPQVDSVFAGKACLPSREAAKSLLSRLAQTARETFTEFEDAVDKDASRQPVEDGAVHPLTSYVINYVKFLFEYHATLQQLFGESEKLAETNNNSSSSGAGKPRLAVVTARILNVLQTNLEGKAKLYKEPALSQIFLMNNVHYMVRSIKKSDAKDMLGDDWLQRQRRVVQQHATAYQRQSWQKVMQLLSTQGLTTGSGESSINRTAVKERFKQFNLHFEELHARQCLWTIPDQELRSAVQLQVAEILLPAYRSFVSRFSASLEQGNTFGKQPNPQKYIKYQPEDLEALLSDLFEGKPRGAKST